MRTTLKSVAAYFESKSMLTPDEESLLDQVNNALGNLDTALLSDSQKQDKAESDLEDMMNEQWFIHQYGEGIDYNIDCERDRRYDEMHLWLEINPRSEHEREMTRSICASMEKNEQEFNAPFYAWCKERDYQGEVLTGENGNAITYKITMYL